MYKKINLTVSSALLVGLFTSGCSQQQINAGSQSAGGQQVYGGSSEASGGVGSPILDGFGNPIKDGFGGIVRDTFASAANAGVYAGDIQTAQMVIPSSLDHQVQNVVVPKAPSAIDHQVQDMVVPKTINKHYHTARPAPKQHRMSKPVQRMAKPTQKRSSAYTRTSAGMPPAKPNQCYAKVRTGPQFKNVVKRVQIRPAVNKRVLVRGPQYRYIPKRVQVRPATHTYSYRPAQYRNISKRVLVKPAHYAWQKGKRGPITRIDNMTGEILCRVKIPAVYRTVVQKVMVRPGQRIKRNIPAVYRTVKHKKLASPAQYRNVRQPARFVNKTYRVKTGGTGYKWQPINC